MLHGVNNVLRNLDKHERAGIKASERGVKKAALATATHIKREYRREVTGKGFTNRTGRLRASIGSKVVFKSKYVIIGYVYAGTLYAPYVEFRWGGKYAYLWPGVRDMQSEIWDIIKKEIRETL